MALLHAWVFWMFAVGGMLLYLLDKMIRMFRAGTIHPRLLEASHSHGITKLVFEKDGSMKYEAGQYAFVNIPSVSPFQWHPFSFSSAPSSNTITFHIKDMGQSTWTNQLAMQVQHMNSKRVYTDGAISPSQSLSPSRSSPLSTWRINMDGPYGRANISGYNSLLLLAGGVGITPIHSIFADLYQRESTTREYRRIHLVFVSRDSHTLLAFASTWNAVSRYNPNNIFEVSLYLTGGDSKSHSSSINLNGTQTTDTTTGVPSNSPGKSELSVPITGGRPDLNALLGAIRTYPSPLVFVCGPASLVDQASEAAFRNSVSFHSETFEL